MRFQRMVSIPRRALGMGIASTHTCRVGGVRLAVLHDIWRLTAGLYRDSGEAGAVQVGKMRPPIAARTVAVKEGQRQSQIVRREKHKLRRIPQNHQRHAVDLFRQSRAGGDRNGEGDARPGDRWRCTGLAPAQEVQGRSAGGETGYRKADDHRCTRRPVVDSQNARQQQPVR